MELLLGFCARLYALCDNGANIEEPFTAFSHRKNRSICLKLYVEQLQEFTTSAVDVLAVTFSCIAKLVQVPGFALTHYNMQRVVASCFFLGYKYCCDLRLSLKQMGDIGGIPWRDLASLELVVLQALKWELYTDIAQNAESLRQQGSAVKEDSEDDSDGSTWLGDNEKSSELSVFFDL